MVSRPQPASTDFGGVHSSGGKVVYIAKAKRSADGKTMTVAVKGTNPSGQTVDGINFYDNQ